MLYIFLVLVSLVFFIGIIGAMIYFSIKFRKGRPGKTKYFHGHVPIEIIWTVIPTILVLGIFVWGWVLYVEMVQAPANAREIRVIGKQWSWQFVYDNGKTTTNEFWVPQNEPVKMIMTATDVLHSFFIPAFRIKQDVVPGMYTTVWFEANVLGEHIVYCAEYCGGDHSRMLAKVHVIPTEMFDRWKYHNKLGDSGTKDNLQVAQAGTVSLVDRGKKLAKVKGCVSCHSADGRHQIGPSYKGRYGKTIDLADGTQIEVDDNYLRESIENPQAKIAKGFNPVMPTFKGQMTEFEMNAIIAYIKSVK